MSELQRIDYSDSGTPLVALHGKPAGQARAAVAVFPTFMNSTPGVEAKARALIDEGYEVLIGDFYGPDAPSNPDEAFVALEKLRGDPPAMRQRLRTTLELLRELAPDGPHLAIGFCLGGMAVLEMALDGQDLLAVASFHGLLETRLPAKERPKARMLVCHGDRDELVPRSHVMAFWEEMDQAGADWHFHSYANVGHGFTAKVGLDGSPNPAFDASADRQSWRAMLGLFDEVLSNSRT
jgi:dienelactone hydrolase